MAPLPREPPYLRDTRDDDIINLQQPAHHFNHHHLHFHPDFLSDSVLTSKDTRENSLISHDPHPHTCHYLLACRKQQAEEFVSSCDDKKLEIWQFVYSISFINSSHPIYMSTSSSTFVDHIYAISCTVATQEPLKFDIFRDKDAKYDLLSVRQASKGWGWPKIPIGVFWKKKNIAKFLRHWTWQITRVNRCLKLLKVVYSWSLT